MLYKAPMAVSCINIFLQTHQFEVSDLSKEMHEDKESKTPVGFQLQNKYTHMVRNITVTLS